MMHSNLEIRWWLQATLFMDLPQWWFFLLVELSMVLLWILYVITSYPVSLHKAVCLCVRCEISVPIPSQLNLKYSDTWIQACVIWASQGCDHEKCCCHVWHYTVWLKFTDTCDECQQIFTKHYSTMSVTIYRHVLPKQQ